MQKTDGAENPFPVNKLKKNKTNLAMRSPLLKSTSFSYVRQSKEVYSLRCDQNLNDPASRISLHTKGVVPGTNPLQRQHEDSFCDWFILSVYLLFSFVFMEVLFLAIQSGKSS